MTVSEIVGLATGSSKATRFSSEERRSARLADLKMTLLSFDLLKSGGKRKERVSLRVDLSSGRWIYRAHRRTCPPSSGRKCGRGGRWSCRSRKELVSDDQETCPFPRVVEEKELTHKITPNPRGNQAPSGTFLREAPQKRPATTKREERDVRDEKKGRKREGETTDVEYSPSMNA